MIEVPTSAMPRSVAKAAEALREREADLEAARQTVRGCEVAIEEACALDRVALADALDKGTTAGTEAEDAARAALAEAQRIAAAHELRRERANAAFEQALRGSLDGWMSSLVKALQTSQGRCLELVDELEAAEQERALQRVGLRWLRAYATNTKLPPPNHAGPTPTSLRMNQNSPATFSVDALLDHVRTGLRAATLDAEAERDAAAVAQAEADDANRARLLGVRQSMT